jgi:hypothetical protein
MGVQYTLVNLDKKQKISFYRVYTGTKLRELSGTVIASTIVTYYLLTNTGDRISFINDTEDRFTVCGQNYEPSHFKDFVDVTNNIIEELIKEKIIKDNGIIWIDKEDNLFKRNLTNIWNPTINK